MRFLIFLITLLLAVPVGAAEDYSECDVDVGCSDEVADYQQVQVKVIGLPDMKRLYESEAAYQLIDVRPRNSFDQRHIKGASSLFVARAKPEEIKAALPDKEARIIVYCSNQRCPMSRHAAQLLVFLGYKDVSNYKGGLEEWSRNGLPTDTTLESPLPTEAVDGS